MQMMVEPCPRCLRNHVLTFKPLSNPTSDQRRAYALCEHTGEPVLGPFGPNNLAPGLDPFLEDVATAYQEVSALLSRGDGETLRQAVMRFLPEAEE